MSNIGYKQSPEHIAKRVQARVVSNTYKHSHETKLVIGLKGIGRKQSPETIAKRMAKFKETIRRPEIMKRRIEIAVQLHSLKAIGSYGKHWKKTKEQLLNKMGSRNPAWKGGITPINAKIRNSEEYATWRKKVLERDNYTCVWCQASSGATLHADHISPFAYFPNLRLELSNGRTLCKPCHMKTDTYGGKYKQHSINL